MTDDRDKTQALCLMIENALAAMLGESDERLWFLASYVDNKVSLVSNLNDPADLRRLAESVARNIERANAQAHVVASTPDTKQ